VAANLGIINEDEINNMSIIFFEDVFEALGRTLTYDAVVNYAGNSFCKDSWEMISEHHPMNKPKNSGKGLDQLANVLGGVKIRTVTGPIDGVTRMKKPQ